MFLYGSSSTGFGLKDSDVNLDLVIPDEVALVAHGYAKEVAVTKLFQLLCKVLLATMFFTQNQDV